MAERWLAELWVGRDKANFSLAPSQIALEPGDVITLPSDPDSLYRLEAAEIVGELAVEVSRIDPAVFGPAPAPASVASSRPAAPPPAPVVPEFLDLLLISGDEVAHQPLVAAFASDWPGQVAVYSSATNEGFTLTTVLSRSAIFGVLTEDLSPGRASLWSRGHASLRLSGGSLQSRDPLAVLNGANTVALKRPDREWEIVQFQSALLQPNGDYRLERLLRGQCGTDGLAPLEIPAGARVVVLDGASRQIPLALSARDLERRYRIGPASVEYSDSSYVSETRAFQGVGLRPYAPAHLSVSANTAGDLRATWVRCARIGGDSWQGIDPPLSEAFERYQVQILQNGVPLRATTVDETEFNYAAAEQIADGVTAPFILAVRQISAEFGPGHASEITINE